VFGDRAPGLLYLIHVIHDRFTVARDAVHTGETARQFRGSRG